MIVCLSSPSYLPAPAGGGAGGNVSFVASSTANDAGSGVVLTKPTGTTENDFLLAWFVCDLQSTVVTGDPGGWTLVEDLNWGIDGQSCFLYYKLATSSEPSDYTWTFNNASASNIGIMGAWRGNKTSATFWSFETVTTNGSSAASPITLGANGGTVVSGDAIAYFAAIDKDASGGTVTWTKPTDYTDGQLVNSVWSAAALFYRDSPPAGATGTINSTATGQSGDWQTVVISIAKA